MTIELARYSIEMFGQEEDGELSETELNFALHPNELEQALGEFLSGQLGREVYARVTRVVEEEPTLDEEAA